MARAGYCSACGNYVFLRPDGGCGNGHGPEYITNPYEVPDAPAQPAAAPFQAPAQPAPQAAQPTYQQAYQPAPAQQPAYSPQAGYAPQAYAQPAYAQQPVAAPPKKKRTGLVIALVAAGLLLLCGCAGAGIAFGVIPNPLTMLASPEHQKVQAAGVFFKAISTADLAGLTRTIPSAAAAAANPAFWTEKVLKATDKATFDGETWTGDVLKQEYTDSGGKKRSITLTAIDGDKVKALMAENGAASGDVGVFTMVREAGGWKVLALGSEGGEEFLRFTPEAIKELEKQGN